MEDAELLQCFTTYLQGGEGRAASVCSADDILSRSLTDLSAEESRPLSSTAEMPILPIEAELKNESIPALERARSSGSASTAAADSHGGRVLRAYAKGITVFEDQLRDALKRFNGYECKEPEPGKFTLAFSCLEDAIMWGTTLQEELLHLDWPHDLLALDECAAVHTVTLVRLVRDLLAVCLPGWEAPAPTCKCASLCPCNDPGIVPLCCVRFITGIATNISLQSPGRRIVP